MVSLTKFESENINLTMRKFTFCRHFYTSFQAEDETVPHPISVFFFYISSFGTDLSALFASVSNQTSRNADFTQSTSM